MMASRSIRALSLAAVLVSAVATNAAAGTPFNVIRGVITGSGTMWLGGAGMTASRLSTGHYRVTFPTGTWKTFVGGALTTCYYIPSFQAISTPATITVTTYTLPTDGSGTVEFETSNGADAMIAMTFTSSNC